MSGPAKSVASGTQFAAWLQKNHPPVFRALLKKATAQSLGYVYQGNFSNRVKLEGLGDYADYFSSFEDALSDSTGLPALADLADDSGSFLDDLSGDATDATDSGSLIDNLDTTPVTTNLDDQLQSAPIETSGDLNAETAVAPTVAIDSGDAASSITPSSAPTSPPSVPTAATQSVGSYLTSAAGAQVLTAALQGASQVLQANAAANVITAQAQRAAAGLAPANVSYVATTDPTTGAIVATPVLNTASGAVALSNAGIDALSPASFLQQYGLYIMLGIGAFVALT